MQTTKPLLLHFAAVCLVLAAHGVRAARRVDAKAHLEKALYKRQLQTQDEMPEQATRHIRDAETLPVSELDQLMSLGPNSALEVTRSAKTVQGTRLLRLQETFKGEPVADAIMTVETDSTGQHVLDASGTVYQGIEEDTDGTGNIDQQRALDICLNFNADDDLKEDIDNVKSEAEIFFDKENRAYPGYFVQYLVLRESEERRPSCIVDARDGRVTLSWDALDSCRQCGGKGIGGNLKIGKIHYGELQNCLEVTRINDTCYTENKYVKVIDNKGHLIEDSSESYNFSDAASYDCEEATDAVNGAYSPILDALFYGTVVGRMFEDWYDRTPLNGQLTVRVHVGTNLSNAFWNGRECQFGDGGDTFHPLVSLDVMGHEIGHGVTEQASNLIYLNQWGAINEAFSDMMGETCEAYLSQADWVMGFSIAKEGRDPLRYFENPSADNYSIYHVDNFTEDLDVHFGSGVYNRVFYLLVHEYQQSVKEIFRVFLHANQMYWHHMSDYTSAACDVMKSAYDLGQDGALFRRAFSEVGIQVCDIENHVIGLREEKLYTDIIVARDISPVFSFTVPAELVSGKMIIFVNADSCIGDVHIVLSTNGWEADKAQVVVQGDSLVQTKVKGNATSLTYYIKLSTKSQVPLDDVILQVKGHVVQNNRCSV